MTVTRISAIVPVHDRSDLLQEAVESLVALRPGVEPAIAFVAESAQPSVIHRLEEADWRVVRVRRPADLPAAWSEAWRSARDAVRSGGRGAS